MFLAWFLPAFAGQPAATILSQVKVVKNQRRNFETFYNIKQEENAILKKKQSSIYFSKMWLFEFLFTGQKVASLTIINKGARKGVSVLSKAILSSFNAIWKQSQKVCKKATISKKKSLKLFKL